MLLTIIEKDKEGLVARAYAFAKKAHEGQKRKPGEPYFTHPAVAGEQLAKWRLDETTIAAGLLHDVLEDTKITNEEIKKEFGEEVLFLVESVSKLGRVKYREKTEEERKEKESEEQAENLRRLILALGQDIRV